MAITRIFGAPASEGAISAITAGLVTVKTSLSDVVTYTVPAGKVLVILAIALQSGSGSGQQNLLADGLILYGMNKGGTSSTLGYIYCNTRTGRATSGVTTIVGAPEATAESVFGSADTKWFHVNRDYIVEIDEGIVLKTSTSALDAHIYGYLIDK